MKAVFINIWIVKKDGTEIDISNRVSRLSYDRDTEKENNLSFSLEQSYNETDEDIPVERGQNVFYQYGYKGGAQSPIHRTRVTEIQYTYGAKIKLSVKARDEGTVMKKSTSTQVWDNVTTSQIAEKIAIRWGLPYRIETTLKVWDSLPQSQKDDWAFLQSVVEMETGGDYICFVEDGILILEKRALQAASLSSFTFRDPNSGIISIEFKEAEKESSAAGASKVKRKGFDTSKGAVVKKALQGLGRQVKTVQQQKKTAKPAIQKAWAMVLALDGYGYLYSADGDNIEQPPKPPKTAAQLAINAISGNSEGTGFDNAQNEEEDDTVDIGDGGITPADDEEEISARAGSVNKKSTLKRATCTLKIEGQPLLVLNSIVTIAGVLKIHAGNYLIKAISDEVQAAGAYITILTLEKNARQKPYTSGQEKIEGAGVNKTVGVENGEEQVAKKLYVFDANGDPK